MDWSVVHGDGGLVHGRLRGLVRVGERRWDVVLDREQRIMLPEQNPIGAVERGIVLSDLQDLLEPAML